MYLKSKNNDRNIFRKKLLSLVVVFLMLFISFFVVFVENAKASGPNVNEIMVTPSIRHVTIQYYHQLSTQKMGQHLIHTNQQLQ